MSIFIFLLIPHQVVYFIIIHQMRNSAVSVRRLNLAFLFGFLYNSYCLHFPSIYYFHYFSKAKLCLLIHFFPCWNMQFGKSLIFEPQLKLNVDHKRNGEISLQKKQQNTHLFQEIFDLCSLDSIKHHLY